ncbi:MAG: arginine--tRNA ligase [Candidatus Pacearchaeota archaeon]
MRKEVLLALKPSGLPSAQLEEILETPKDSTHGDFAFPCFALAKNWKKNPVEIAKELVVKMGKLKGFEKVEAVGPYVNFFVDKKILAREILNKISHEKNKYGSNANGKGKKFMIEFSQPNTHKAFHVGHIRGTSLGESIARLREFCGYNVIRANYSGDTGMHIAKWMWCYTKFHSKEEIKSEESWFAKIYVEAVQKLEGNEEAEAEVLAINRKLDERKDKKIMKLWTQTRLMSIAAWKPIYKDLDVQFDKHFFESKVEKAGKRIALELVKRGIATISDGATIMDLKDKNLGVWVLLRSDGTVLYSAKDLALAEDKSSKYRVDESLVITSVEQNLHFQQLQKTLEAMKFKNWKDYGHLGYESVRLPEGKMSSRTGNNILYAEFREELIASAKEELSKRFQLNENEVSKRALAIAIASMKYPMLKQDTNKIIIFDKEEATRFEGDTGPYLLYSYARAKSILKKAKKSKKHEAPKEISESEKNMVKELAIFPQVVTKALENTIVSGIAHYVYTLSQTFNEFYHSSQVIGSAEEVFRIELVKAFCTVMENAMHLLGIFLLEEM